MVIEDHQGSNLWLQSWEESDWQMGDNLCQGEVGLWSSEVGQDWAKGCWLGDHQCCQGVKLRRLGGGILIDLVNFGQSQ